MSTALITLRAAVTGLTALASSWIVTAQIAAWIASQVASNAAAWGEWMEDSNLSTSEAQKDRIVQEALVHAVCGLSSNISKIMANTSDPQVLNYAPMYTPLMGNPSYLESNDSKYETMIRVFTKIMSGLTVYSDIYQHIDSVPIANIAEKIENLSTILDARLSFYDPEDLRVKSLAEMVWEIAKRPSGAANGLTFEEWKQLFDSYFMVEVGNSEVSISDLIISLLNHGNFLYY